MLAVAIAAAAGSGIQIVPNVPKTKSQPLSIVSRTRRNVATRAHSSYCQFGYHKGPGWTVAKVKRMAKKARNQKRHRKATKGGAA